jgi:hypothetical protein
MNAMPKIDINWIAVGSGRLALWHRPAFRVIPRLRGAGCDRVVTLLSAREGAEQIGEAVRAAGLDWSWIPMDGGVPPPGRRTTAIVAGLVDVSRALDRGQSVLIHCAAGIHRTGMVAYALLRLRGASATEALDALHTCRIVTRKGLDDRRLAWGEYVLDMSRSGRAIDNHALSPREGVVSGEPTRNRQAEDRRADQELLIRTGAATLFESE